jgi:hypothetical protein
LAQLSAATTLRVIAIGPRAIRASAFRVRAKRCFVAFSLTLAMSEVISQPVLPQKPPAQWQTELMESGAALIREGKYEAGTHLFAQAADNGDDRAMVSLGLYALHGRNGIVKNYGQAHMFFSKALGPTPYRLTAQDYKPNGFAIINLGVMFRDGLGVAVNRKIAHALFTFEYARNGYSEESVGLSSGNLNRDLREMSEADLDAALCLNMEHVWAYVKSKGLANEIAASEPNPRIRDWKTWLPGEMAKVKC